MLWTRIEAGCLYNTIPAIEPAISSSCNLHYDQRNVDNLHQRDKADKMTDSEEVGRNLDLGIALSHVDGDRQLLAELAALFLKDYPRLLEEMRESILKSDFSGLERGAHTLKGRLAFFGIQRVREMALELEMMGRRRESARTGQSLAAIETEMKGILPEFEALAREQSA
jgi:HPt (histidine-containing phosphotransfer) domain-containing protein